MLDVDSRQGRAAIMILLLGVALLLALAPFASGLLSAPVFYVVFAPLYQRLKRRLRPSLAAGAHGDPRGHAHPRCPAPGSWR